MFAQLLQDITKRKSRIVSGLLLLIMTVVLLGAAQWDSAADPLVTKSWVDSYVDKKVQALETRVNSLGSQLGIGSGTIELWINKKEAKINGVTKALDAPPIIHNSRTMLPLRFLADGLGAKVEWDNTKKKVTYTKGSIKLELVVNQSKLWLNGKEEALDGPPILNANRVLVPVRVVSDKLGAKVDWDNTTKKVTVKY